MEQIWSFSRLGQTEAPRKPPLALKRQIVCRASRLRTTKTEIRKGRRKSLICSDKYVTYKVGLGSVTERGSGSDHEGAGGGGRGIPTRCLVVMAKPPQVSAFLRGRHIWNGRWTQLYHPMRSISVIWFILYYCTLFIISFVGCWALSVTLVTVIVQEEHAFIAEEQGPPPRQQCFFCGKSVFFFFCLLQSKRIEIWRLN